MKRTIWITLVLLLLCVFVLSACDSGRSNNGGGNNEVDAPTTCQHVASNWITDKDVTCKEAGFKHKECTKCEEVLETASIDKLTTHTPVIDSRVEPTFTSTGLTEGSHCGVCGVVIVAQDVIPMIPSKTTLTTTTLALDGRNTSGSFSYATEIFNFANDITVTNNSPWVVSTDIYGMQTVATKIVPLHEGNNTFYIHVTNPDQTVSTYTVNIYRNHLYTVRFNTNGGVSVPAQYVEEGYLAEQPTTERAGYTFSSWDYDFTTPISSNMTINAAWTANGNTPYKVEYYLQNVDQNGYDLVETVNLTGETDTTAYAEQKTFEHFTLSTYQSTLSGNINGNGGLVLKVYYTRDTYSVSTDKNNTKGGTITWGGNYAYGKEITLTATTNAGYTFLGWYSGDELLSEDTEYATVIDRNIIAKFDVAPEMQNFVFSSTATTCTISEIKDNTVTEIVVPDYITAINRGAFQGCTSIESITVSQGNTQYHSASNCLIETENKTLVIGCKNSIIPDDGSVTSIGSYAFYGCTELTSITIPDSVTSIGYRAFYGCSNLESITIPFVGATKSGTSDTHFGYIFGASSASYNDDCVPASLRTVIITGGESIGGQAFFNCSGLTSISLGKGVESIDGYAFYNCKNLKTISMQNNIRFIGKCNFSYCYSLSEIYYNGAYEEWSSISCEAGWNYLEFGVSIVREQHIILKCSNGNGDLVLVSSRAA